MNMVSIDKMDGDWLLVGQEDVYDDFKNDLKKAEDQSRVVYDLSKEEKQTEVNRELEQKGYKTYKIGSTDMNQKGIYLSAIVNKDNQEITVSCRGTKFDDPSIFSDLDPNGPGYTVMKESRHQILEDLNEIMQGYSNTNIKLTGHSLGGSLSQILASFLMEEKLDPNNNFPNLNKISGIDLALFQSSGVNDDIVRSCNENARILAKQGFAINLIAHVNKKDIVHRTGKYILADVDHNVAKVNLVTTDILNTRSYLLKLGQGVLTTLITSWSAGKLGTINTLANIAVNSCNTYASLIQDAHRHKLFEKQDGMRVFTNSDEYGRKEVKSTFEEQLIDFRGIKSFLYGVSKDIKTQDLQKIQTVVETSTMFRKTFL